MKCVIYGAGMRGQRVLEILGTENVIAYVDADEVGTQYNNIPIMGVEFLKTISSDVLCVISPLGGTAIAESLRKEGICNYILLNQFDRMLYIYHVRDTIFHTILEQCGDKGIGVYGISVGSILLYEYLTSQQDRNVILIPEVNAFAEDYSYLHSDYKTANLKNVFNRLIL